MTALITREKLAAELAAKYGSDLQATQEAVDTYAGQLQDDDIYDTENDQMSWSGADMIRQQFAEDQAVTAVADTTLNDIVEAEAKRVAAQQQADDALAERDALVRKAIRFTYPVKDIAEAAGVKPARVYQIRDGRR